MSEEQAPYEPRLPDEREAWSAASLVIEEHGSRAPKRAQGRIAALTDAGDGKGAAMWRLILDRIERLQVTPETGNLQ